MATASQEITPLCTSTLSDRDRQLRRTGFITFGLSGICSISSGIIVSLLREKYGLSFALTGSLLSAMSIGNVIAAFLSGFLPARVGQRAMVLVMSTEFFLGYTLTTLTGSPLFLILAFLMVGLAKGCTLNTDSVLVGRHTDNRTRDMQIMHSCYAVGALSCPMIIAALTGIGTNAPMIGIALFGALLWCVYLLAALPGKQKAPATTVAARRVSSAPAPSSTQNTPASGSAQNAASDYSFLRTARFWLLTSLIFCQNAAETSVTGWLVTYYKDQQILTKRVAGYTMTVMWGATLIARLLIAFVLPIRNRFRALLVMGCGCTLMYSILVFMKAPVPAIIALFLFSFAMAGVNPMGTASVGEALSPESMGILLPIGGIGAILFPLLIGFVADAAGLQAGMMVNLIPCIGLIVISSALLVGERKRRAA